MKTIRIADPEYPGGLLMREGTMMVLEWHADSPLLWTKLVCFSADPSSVDRYDEMVQMMVDESGVTE